MPAGKEQELRALLKSKNLTVVGTRTALDGKVYLLYKVDYRSRFKEATTVAEKLSILAKVLNLEDEE